MFTRKQWSGLDDIPTQQSGPGAQFHGAPLKGKKIGIQQKKGKQKHSKEGTSDRESLSKIYSLIKPKPGGLSNSYFHFPGALSKTDVGGFQEALVGA